MSVECGCGVWCGVKSVSVSVSWWTRVGHSRQKEKQNENDPEVLLPAVGDFGWASYRKLGLIHVGAVPGFAEAFVFFLKGAQRFAAFFFGSLFVADGIKRIADETENG